jgi:hypothetical protein
VGKERSAERKALRGLIARLNNRFGEVRRPAGAEAFLFFSAFAALKLSAALPGCAYILLDNDLELLGQ